MSSRSVRSFPGFGSPPLATLRGRILNSRISGSIKRSAPSRSSRKTLGFRNSRPTPIANSCSSANSVQSIAWGCYSVKKKPGSLGPAVLVFFPPAIRLRVFVRPTLLEALPGIFRKARCDDRRDSRIFLLFHFIPLKEIR
jgi:hypothetical protein